MSTDIIARGLTVRESRQRVRNTTPRLSIISGSRATPAGSGNQTIATAGAINSTRIMHVNRTGKRVHGISLLFSNYGVSSSTEAQNANIIQAKSSIEYDGTASVQSGIRALVFTRGTWLNSIGRGAVVVSDPDFSRVIEPGATFYERTGVTVLNNGDATPRSQVALGGTSQWGQNTGEGVDAAADKIDYGAGSITANASSGYSATCVLGYCTDGTVAPSVAILGDSIQVGTDDGILGANSGGWAERCFASYPFVKLAISGEKLLDFIVPQQSYRRRQIASYATHVIDCYGRNDIAVNTVAQIKANILANAYIFMARGQVYIKSTILPAPTSTDGWFTTANQSKETYDSVRVGVNQWLRDTSASGFIAQANAQVVAIPYAGVAKVMDVCAPIECDISGTLTDDGGYILGAQSAVLKTATASAATSTTITTSGMTANAYVGKSLYIASGTGAGQSRVIAYNSATVLTVANAYTTPPDNTSVFQIFDGLGMTSAVHPHTKQSTMIAAYWQGARVDALMQLPS